MLHQAVLSAADTLGGYYKTTWKSFSLAVFLMGNTAVSDEWESGEMQ